MLEEGITDNAGTAQGFEISWSSAFVRLFLTYYNAIRAISVPLLGEGSGFPLSTQTKGCICVEIFNIGLIEFKSPSGFWKSFSF